MLYWLSKYKYISSPSSDNHIERNQHPWEVHCLEHKSHEEISQYTGKTAIHCIVKDNSTPYFKEEVVIEPYIFQTLSIWFEHIDMDSFLFYNPYHTLI